MTYTERLTLHAGGVEVRFIHPGVARTAGDTMVRPPERGVVFTGDLVFHGGTPLLATGALRAVGPLRPPTAMYGGRAVACNV
ncbi:MBL fold metallo-hydrolase [Streptomyces thermolilacinus]|uniref:Metallo-beta-lactamase domain-containing protein n=1 Tax=Streptomyces thermolilacinus SPC6 TaxID=1306406 RepID=A0A1D3DX68_9ACTN|nr:hypothetical protein [Streptomyces thermolilacinus]OEJ96914.1 hypothetical protein J116_023165 [Streptomyces thermolilacinus SPC6]